MAKRLTGLNPLAYMGVEPLMPSNTITASISPTTNDFQGINVGDEWINTSTQQIWIFVGLNTMREAQWIEIGTPAGVGASSFVTDSGTAVSTGLGVINILGGSNVNTDGSVPNTVTINLDNSPSVSGSVTAGTGISVTAGNIEMVGTGNFLVDNGSIYIPLTTADGIDGIIYMGGSPYIQSVGTQNTFIGLGAGNLTLNIGSATSNSSLGFNTLNAITTGQNNAAIGDGALVALTSGSYNIALGSNTAESLLTGQQNVFLGNAAGSNYTGAESSNILVGNDGTIGESNVIRIGTTGSSAGEQNKCFIAGISGVTTDVADAVTVLIDSAGQLGVTSSSRVYKDNIVSMRDESLGIMALRPVTFEYKSDVRNTKQYGFIAEEVAEVMPDLVVYNQEGKPETVKYHVMPAIIVNELQRLNDRINELQVSCMHGRAD